MKHLKYLLAIICASWSMSALAQYYVFVKNNTDNYKNLIITLNVEAEAELTCSSSQGNDNDNNCNPFTTTLHRKSDPIDSSIDIFHDFSIGENPEINLTAFSITFKKDNEIISVFTFDKASLTCLQDELNKPGKAAADLRIKSRQKIFVDVWGSGGLETSCKAVSSS
jgi:hypothetical protein